MMLVARSDDPQTKLILDIMARDLPPQLLPAVSMDVACLGALVQNFPDTMDVALREYLAAWMLRQVVSNHAMAALMAQHCPTEGIAAIERCQAKMDALVTAFMPQHGTA